MSNQDSINREWVLQNLQETIDHIRTVIADVKAGNTASLEVWMPFIYRDLDRAWNGRFIQAQADSGSEPLCNFPSDIDVSD